MLHTGVVMLNTGDANYSLISAVREGRLDKTKELINSFGLSYSPAWSEGYSLLCDALKNKHVAVSKLLLKSGSKVHRESINPSETPLHFAVIIGDIEIVEMILDKGTDVDAKNQWGRTPLHNATENKKIEVIELLLKHRADVNASNCRTSPLHIACKIGCLEIVKLLLNYGAYVNRISTTGRKKSNAPLHIAMEEGSKEVIKLLLSRGANVNVNNEDFITPLHIAAKKGYIDIAEDLLNHGACINSLTLKRGYTPLHLATELGNEEIVKLLLNRGADVNVATKQGLTPLQIATKSGHEKVVKLLLEHGAEVDNQDKDGKNILYLAVEKGHLMITKHILQYCPDINNKCNRSSLITAVFGCGKLFKNIVEALLEYGFNVNPEDANNPKLLHAAVENGYLKIVEDLLKYGANVNSVLLDSTSDKGFTPLHTAAKNKQEGAAKLLIDYGSDKGFTPLHTAAKHKQEGAAKLLIDYGAVINAQADNRQTPLFYAVENGDIKFTNLLLSNKANVKDPHLLNIAVMNEYMDIVEVFLKHGADVNASDEHGRTALHFTAILQYFVFTNLLRITSPDIHSKTKIAKLLLSKGANVDAQTKNGMTTLHFAIKEGYAKLVEVLLDYNANVNSTKKGNIIPLHLSAMKGIGEISRMLLNKGANVNYMQKGGSTALHIAIKNGHEKVVKVLLKYGANVDSKTKSDINLGYQKAFREIETIWKSGPCIEAPLESDANVNCRIKKSDFTPLHLSAVEGNNKIRKMLLNKGANVNVKQTDGITPLHIATIRGHKEAVKELLEYGANVDSIMRSNITSLHLSAHKGFQEIVETILKFDADIDFRDEYGRTALHIASQEGHVEVVETLLKFGADINIMSRNNHTPFDYAMAEQTTSDYFKADDSCDEYFFDVSYSDDYSDKVTEVLDRHIIKMKTANLYLRENLLSMDSSYSDDEEFENEFQVECKKEITIMKNEKISNCNISFYDILAKSTTSLATYMWNESIVQVLKSYDYRKFFPIYGSIIECHFKRGVERKVLLEQGEKFYHFLFIIFPQLPHDCIDNIISYLSNKDLEFFNGWF